VADLTARLEKIEQSAPRKRAAKSEEAPAE